MKTGIHVGMSGKAVKRAHKAIIAILQQKCDQATIQKALDCFAHSVQINNVAITSNSVMDQRGKED